MVDALRNAPAPQCYYRGREQDQTGNTISICASVAVWDSLLKEKLIDGDQPPAPIFGYLVYANDSAHLTFEQIADCIEQHELTFDMTDADGAAFQAHHPNVRKMEVLATVKEYYTAVAI